MPLRPVLILLLMFAPTVVLAGEVIEQADHNLRFRVPAGWVQKPGESPGQLHLVNRDRMAWITSGESETTPAAALEAMTQRLKPILLRPGKIVRIQRKQPRPVAIAIMEGTIQGQRLTVVAAALTHQGILTQVVLQMPACATEQAERLMQVFLGNLSHLGPRKDWLARFAGTPQPYALAGGAVRLAIPRPRWRDTTLEVGTPAWENLDLIHFTWNPGGAWITVNVLRADRPEATVAAMERTAHEWLPGSRAEIGEDRFGDRACPTVTVRKDTDGVAKEMRGVLVRSGDLAVRCWLESDPDGEAMILGDFQALVAGIAFISDPAATAFALPDEAYRPDADLDPELIRLLPPRLRAMDGQVLAIAPAGDRLLVRRDDSLQIDQLQDGRSRPLECTELPAWNGPVAWSPDGARLCWTSDGHLVVAEVDPWQVRRLPVKAFHPCWRKGRILACTLGVDFEAGPQHQVASGRLVEIDPASGAERLICSYPLARFSFPRVSADGRRIALLCNRDVERTGGRTGGIHVADLGDGAEAAPIAPTSLRLLARWGEPLAWTQDGHLLRTLHNGGGSLHVQSLDPAAGRARTLAGGAWFERPFLAGGDLLFTLGPWNLPEDRKGLYRVSLAELRRQPVSTEEPPDDTSEFAIERVESDLRSLLGTPLEGVVPDPELMARLADGLVGSVRRHLGVRLAVDLDALGRLPGLNTMLAPYADGRRSARLLALGALYGECLRRSGLATWRIEPMPFGRWCPAQPFPGNAVVRVVDPFSAISGVLTGREYDALLSRTDLRQGDGRDLILIYPPAAAPSVCERLAGTDYALAWIQAEQGRFAEAVSLLETEISRRPRARPLVTETLLLAQAAGQPVDALLDRVVANGCIVPSILARRATELSTRDPARARHLLRIAAGAPDRDGRVLLQLGDLWESGNDLALARTSWRRAWRLNRDLLDEVKERFTRTEPVAPADDSRPASRDATTPAVDPARAPKPTPKTVDDQLIP